MIKQIKKFEYCHDVDPENIIDQHIPTICEYKISFNILKTNKVEVNIKGWEQEFCVVISQNEYKKFCFEINEIIDNWNKLNKTDTTECMLKILNFDGSIRSRTSKKTT